jgi:uncharacterized protein YfaP (DUF2135 family)
MTLKTVLEGPGFHDLHANYYTNSNRKKSSINIVETRMDTAQTTVQAGRGRFKLDFIVICNQNAGETSIIKSFSVGEGIVIYYWYRPSVMLIHLPSV